MHDGICVAEFDSTAAERRRSPRFNCGGRAKIYCLPFDGTSLSGTLRNLSLGGICLDMAAAVEPGARMEVLVRVSAASFRAGALVRGQRDSSGTSLEFVQISAGAKDVLADLLVRLATLRALNGRLRSSRLDEDTERLLMQEGKVRFAMVGKAGRSAVPADSFVFADEQETSGECEIVEPRLIEIDLFG
ncbi:MAG: PilZ domain-containing protein [Terriglobales bacterium]